MDRERQLLQGIGLDLKGEDGEPQDIRYGNAEVLGFNVTSQAGKVNFSIAKGRWRTLSEGLDRAHQAESPDQEAQKAILGWLEAAAPAFEGKRTERTLERVLEMAALRGFRELNADTLRAKMTSAWERWRDRLACREAELATTP